MSMIYFIIVKFKVVKVLGNEYWQTLFFKLNHVSLGKNNELIEIYMFGHPIWSEIRKAKLMNVFEYKHQH